MNQHLVFNENIKSFDLNNIFKYVEGKYGVFTLDSIREYLRLSKRIEKCKIDVYFINSCLQNNITLGSYYIIYSFHTCIYRNFYFLLYYNNMDFY